MIRDYGEALRWFRKAAEVGTVQAYPFSGRIYEEGLGVKQDLVEAYGWYSQAAPDQEAARAKVSELSKHLTAQQVSEALRRGNDWQIQHPRQ